MGPPCRSAGRSAGRVSRARASAARGRTKTSLGSAVRRAVAAADAAEAARAADAGPVRGAVGGAAEARRIDEGLQQQQRMAEARRPVGGRAPRAQRQHARRQVRRARPRQHQEAAVVGEQVLAVVLDAEVPADPAVAGGALQRRRREAGQRQPLAAQVRRVPHRLADLRQRPEVVVRRHQPLVAALVAGFHRLHGHLAQLHAAPGPVQKTGPFYPPAPPMSSFRVKSFLPLGFSRATNPPWYSGRGRVSLAVFFIMLRRRSTHGVKHRAHLRVRLRRL